MQRVFRGYMYGKQFGQQGHLSEIYSGAANGTEGCEWQTA